MSLFLFFKGSAWDKNTISRGRDINLLSGSFLFQEVEEVKADLAGLSDVRQRWGFFIAQVLTI